MKPFSETCKPFLEHFNACQGCHEKRNLSHCKYALECTIAEILRVKGIAKSQDDLLRYAEQSGDDWYLPEGWRKFIKRRERTD